MKVLVIRLSSIGDIIVTTPVIRCLKKQLAVEIHYLVKPDFREVIRHNPYIDKLILYDKNIVNELKSESYDFIIDMHKSIRSLLLRWKLGIKAYDYDKVNIKKWIYVKFKKDFLPQKHLVDRYFEGIEELKVVNDGAGLDYYYEDEELSIELPKDYEVIVLGAAHMTKRITNVLAEKIINKSKYPIILLGGKDVAGQAKNLVKSKVTDLTSRTTLNQAAKIIQGAVLVHTGDTGLMHMAAALKKPTHVYWANTHPKMGMYPYYGDYAIYTKWFEVEGLSCRPCSKLGHPVCPEGHHKCMDHNIDLV